MAGFKAHESHGPRLGMIRPLGAPRLARAVGSAAAPAPAVRQAPAKEPKGKGGRPRTIGEPWLAEGVSRRTWERRRKASRRGVRREALPARGLRDADVSRRALAAEATMPTVRPRRYSSLSN